MKRVDVEHSQPTNSLLRWSLKAITQKQFSWVFAASTATPPNPGKKRRQCDEILQIKDLAVLPNTWTTQVSYPNLLGCLGFGWEF